MRKQHTKAFKLEWLSQGFFSTTYVTIHSKIGLTSVDPFAFPEACIPKYQHFVTYGKWMINVVLKCTISKSNALQSIHVGISKTLTILFMLQQMIIILL